MSSSSRSKLLRVALISLGCPKNLVDSEIMLGLLPRNRYRIITSPDQADIIIINTCAFLESARREAFQAIEWALARKRRRGVKLIVSGCLVQYYGEKAAELIPAADLLLGVGEYGALPDALEEREPEGGKQRRLLARQRPRFPFQRVFPRLISTPSHLAYLRIADGCDNRCTYCLVPGLRGPYQERPLPVILSEARRLVAQGVREIILIAQDTAYYGHRSSTGADLSLLLEALNEIPGLRWIRVLYAHPVHIERGLLQTMASCDKICPYLDIPLQHINDAILKRMGRKINRAGIEALLSEARETVEGISLRTTLMVGFPGEGEDEFSELIDFVRRERFAHLGVFSYSPEAGTVACRYASRVDGAVARRRRERLMEIQQAVSAEYGQALRGESITVLVDGRYPEPGSPLMIGHAAFQAPEIDGIVVIEGEGLLPGDMVTVRITDSSAYDLYGIKE